MSGFAGRPGLTDIETAEMLLDEARGFFSAAEQAFDFFASGPRLTTCAATGADTIWSLTVSLVHSTSVSTRRSRFRPIQSADDRNTRARRDGDLLSIRGAVTHGFSGRERFDFNPGQPGSFSALMLEGAGEAAPSTMAFEREQDVGAELRYEPDGSLTPLRSTWGTVR